MCPVGRGVITNSNGEGAKSWGQEAKFPPQGECAMHSWAVPASFAPESPPTLEKREDDDRGGRSNLTPLGVGHVLISVGSELKPVMGACERP